MAATLALGACAREDALFTDVAEDTGLSFQHVTGADGRYYFPEIMSAGVALLDYDNDGDLDVYLVQSGYLGDRDAPTLQPMDRLFRNQLVELGELAFSEETVASGITGGGYGSGAVAGDINNDGWVDLYVTNFGANQLWVNNGDGSFSEQTVSAGVTDDRWSTSASFVDYDRDGWLDLYVANYVDFLLNSPTCTSASGRLDYCGPHNFVPTPDTLFHNRGDGTFENVTVVSGIGLVRAPGLGVISTDLNNDGWVDLYVANDRMRNNLWINSGTGRFRDTAMTSGVAVNIDGMAEASMGVDVGDVSGDGHPDIFMTHLLGETNTLYVNQGDGTFHDQSAELGLGATSLPYTGFGTALFDYDNDGWTDLAVANGAVRLYTAQLSAGEPYPYREPNQLFRNNAGIFEDVSASAGAFSVPQVSRGLALGDLNNDGAIDMLVTNAGGPAQLFINQAASAHWLGVRALTQSGRDAYGARVIVQLNDGSRLVRQIRADGSYLSANDPRVVAGLGEDPGPVLVRVRWPEDRCEIWRDVQVDTYVTFQRGQGEEEPGCGL